MSRNRSSGGASTSNTPSPANSNRSGGRGRGRNTQVMRPPTPPTPPQTFAPNVKLERPDTKDMPPGVYIKRPRFKLCDGSFMVDLFMHGRRLIGHTVNGVILPIFNVEKQMIRIEYDANGKEIARPVMKTIAEAKEYGVFSTIDDLAKKVEKARQEKMRNNPASTSGSIPKH